MTAQTLTRRSVLLTALDWFPVGLTVPVLVLLAQVRDLTLGQIGFVFAVFGVLGALLELPTSSLLCLRLPGASRDEEPLLGEPLDDGQHLLGGLGVADPGAAGQHGEQVTHPPGAVAAGEQRRAIDVNPA